MKIIKLLSLIDKTILFFLFFFFLLKLIIPRKFYYPKFLIFGSTINKDSINSLHSSLTMENFSAGYFISKNIF